MKESPITSRSVRIQKYIKNHILIFHVINRKLYFKYSIKSKSLFFSIYKAIFFRENSIKKSSTISRSV